MSEKHPSFLITGTNIEDVAHSLRKHFAGVELSVQIEFFNSDTVTFSQKLIPNLKKGIAVIAANQRHVTNSHRLEFHFPSGIVFFETYNDPLIQWRAGNMSLYIENQRMPEAEPLLQQYGYAPRLHSHISHSYEGYQIKRITLRR